MPTKDSARLFERLDVLVCGRCRAAFHLLEEFSSHSKTCKGDAAAKEDLTDRTDEAVAAVLWANTVRRVLDEAEVAISDRGKSYEYIPEP